MLYEMDQNEMDMIGILRHSWRCCIWISGAHRGAAYGRGVAIGFQALMEVLHILVFKTPPMKREFTHNQAY